MSAGHSTRNPAPPSSPRPERSGPLDGQLRRDPPPDEAGLLRKIIAVCGHLSALASQDVGLAAITAFMAERNGEGVALLDRGLEVLACAGVADPGEVVGRLRERSGAAGLHTVLAAAARNRRALIVPVLAEDVASVIVAPVIVGNEVAGYLLTASKRDQPLAEDMRLMVTEHAAMVCGVVLGRDTVVAAAAGRARQELFEALLQPHDRDNDEVDRWAKHLGFDARRPHHVLAVALGELRGAAGLASVESAFSRLAADAIVAGRPDELVAIVPVAEAGAAGLAQARALAARSVEVISERGLATASVGIGDPCQAAPDIARSYAEARLALAAAQRMGVPGSIAAFADLGIHQLLLRVPEVADLKAFAESVIGRLLEEERASGMEYLETLAAFFQENSSPRRTAQRLHVHPNTVNYRVRRIEEITGLALNVHRDRLMAEVAVEIYRGLGGRR
jgi:PucR family transcriptional regulator, purine catabolism regulatory protein